MSDSAKGWLLLIVLAVGGVWYLKSWQADNAKYCAEKGMTYAPIGRSLAKLCKDGNGLIHDFSE